MAKIYTATKSFNPWDVDDNTGWNVIGNGTAATEMELVPLVSACIDEIAKSLADLPFSVYNQAGAIVDDSDDYKNITGAIPDPYTFLWLAGASLVMSGQAYWRKRRNPAGYTKALDYWAFANVVPQVQPTTTPETLTFRRADVAREIPADEVLYMWMPDPKIELGPATNYPLKRALKSAGSLSAISSFIDNYMNSGMVKAFIAQSDVPPKDETEKREMEDYLTRILTGVRKTLSKIRVIRKSLTIQSIGGGLDELKNVSIVKEIKIDVMEAFGVPESRIHGNAANYATAANDTLIFVTTEIMPLARIIQSALNEQVFAKYGYKLVFEPRRMEEFAVVLGEKIKSLDPVAAFLERALKPAEAMRAAVDLLGLDLSPELIKKIDAAILEADTGPEPSPAPPVVPALPAPEPQPVEVAPTKALVELARWQAKSEKQGKIAKWHAVDFPYQLVEAVKAGMTWDDARERLRNGDFTEGQEKSIAPAAEIMALAEAINRAADATKAAPIQIPSPSYTVNLTAQMPAPGEPTITVNVPNIPAPVVTVNVPDQPAPMVNVQPAQVTVKNNVTAIPGESKLVLPSPQPVEIVRDTNGLAKEIRTKK